MAVKHNICRYDVYVQFQVWYLKWTIPLCTYEISFCTTLRNFIKSEPGVAGTGLCNVDELSAPPFLISSVVCTAHSVVMSTRRYVHMFWDLHRLAQVWSTWRTSFCFIVPSTRVYLKLSCLCNPEIPYRRAKYVLHDVVQVMYRVNQTCVHNFWELHRFVQIWQTRRSSFFLLSGCVHIR